MGLNEELRTYVLQHLDGAIPRLQTKDLAGGVGLCFADVFFGIIFQDALYLKTNRFTRPRFQSYGMEPLKPYGEEGSALENYYRVPQGVLENPELLREWAREALGVALEKKARRIAAEKSRRKRRFFDR